MASIAVSSIVSSKDRRGYVQVFKDEETKVAWSMSRGQTETPIAQLSPAEAREIAVHLIEAANAAETDAFLVEFLMGRIGVKFEEAARVLPEFRDFRTREHSRPVDVEKVNRPLGDGEH